MNSCVPGLNHSIHPKALITQSSTGDRQTPTMGISLDRESWMIWSRSVKWQLWTDLCLRDESTKYSTYCTGTSTAVRTFLVSMWLNIEHEWPSTTSTWTACLQISSRYCYWTGTQYELYTTPVWTVRYTIPQLQYNEYRTVRHWRSSDRPNPTVDHVTLEDLRVDQRRSSLAK